MEILESSTDLVQTFGIQPLIDKIRVKIKVLNKDEVRNDRSNYCIAFYSEKKPFYLENIGFIGQQIDLALQARGVGTCWWGMKLPKKDHRKIGDLDCVITMTAGCPKNNEERRYPDGFKRKAAGDILIGDKTTDNLIEAVRIAPSAINLQPWLIEKKNNTYNFYLRRPRNILELLTKNMRPVDIGIAMAHMFVQAKADGKNVTFSFEGKDSGQSKYIASIVI